MLSGGGIWHSNAVKGLLDESLELSSGFGVGGRSSKEAISAGGRGLEVENPHAWPDSSKCKNLVSPNSKSFSPSKIFASSGGLEDIINFPNIKGVWRTVGGVQSSGKELGDGINHPALFRTLFPKEPLQRSSREEEGLVGVEKITNLGVFAWSYTPYGDKNGNL